MKKYCLRNRFQKKIRLFFLCAGLLLAAGNMQAQNKADSAVAKKSKATKVFYGQASFYAAKFQGRKTANGEIFDHKKMTCACNVLPLGTWVKITNLKNGKTVVVKTNDRLHPKMKRIVDLTRAAATKLNFVSSGVTRVKVEVLGKKAP